MFEAGDWFEIDERIFEVVSVDEDNSGVWCKEVKYLDDTRFKLRYSAMMHMLASTLKNAEICRNEEI